MRKWLVDIRKRNHMTQDEVATICGISRQYYSFIETGARNAPVKTAKKIAAALGFDWNLFFKECQE